MCRLFDEIFSIPPTLYGDKLLIRHVLTAGPVGCENPPASAVTLNASSYLFSFCTLIWGLCECCISLENETCVRILGLKRPERGMSRDMKRQKVTFFHLCSSSFWDERKRILQFWYNTFFLLQQCKFCRKWSSMKLFQHKYDKIMNVWIVKL